MVQIMPMIGDLDWDYDKIWDEIDDAMTLLESVKVQLSELVESNSTVNGIIYPKLIEASTKITQASKNISALTSEDGN